MKAGRRSGFTIVELAAVTVGVAVGGGMCTLVLGPGGSGGQPAGEKQPEGNKPKDDQLKAIGIARAKARQVKDSAQVRGIIQAMHIWGNVNKDKFPLPSEIDLKGTTVAGELAAKDTTANILSILIYTGGISVELCVSSAEASGNIALDKDYMFDQPKTAVSPAEAMWDPAFSADFTGGKTGNVSYAHLQPAGARKSRWSATFITNEAVVGNRGPRIEKIETDADGNRSAKVADPNSVTFLIHGERDRWEGNIAYNDAHVNFEESLLQRLKPGDTSVPAFVDKDGKAQPDCLFYDEADDAGGSNAFLGIFVKSAAEVKNWEAIWD